MLERWITNCPGCDQEVVIFLYEAVNGGQRLLAHHQPRDDCDMKVHGELDLKHGTQAGEA